LGARCEHYGGEEGARLSIEPNRSLDFNQLDRRMKLWSSGKGTETGKGYDLLDFGGYTVWDGETDSKGESIEATRSVGKGIGGWKR
jgi:hypothetical protein